MEITEYQDVSPSRDPIDEDVERDVSDLVREDGLSDAIEGAEG